MIEAIKECSRHVGIVVHTGWGDRDFAKDAIAAGADALLHKGAAQPEDISLQIQFAILNKQQQKEQHAIEATLEKIGRIVDKIGTIHD